jgi:DNA repair exonuclease SbcCD nuclease subunit
MKFAHLGDCHLGSWRIPALQELNLESFRRAIDICIKEKVEFILIAGDLFDSAYPPIEILKETFFEFKKLKEAGVLCFIIAGSHDYSVSGKTFLDVLEKAGFCQNLFRTEERHDKILLNPVIHKEFALYGYPGKKTGMEIPELRKVKLQESPGFFKILVLHTSIKGAVGTLPIDSIAESDLPIADYYALGHLHVDYAVSNFVYSGPIFPNNFQELEELKCGTFYIVDVTNRKMSLKRVEIKIKDVEAVDLEIKNTLTATDKIISELDKRNLKDKIIILKLSGKIEKGKVSNINFAEIESFVRNKGAFTLVKSTSGLESEEIKLEIEVSDMDQIEDSIISSYINENPTGFTRFVNPLINSLSMERQDDEKSAIFEDRLFGEISKILSLG